MMFSHMTEAFITFIMTKIKNSQETTSNSK